MNCVLKTIEREDGTEVGLTTALDTKRRIHYHIWKLALHSERYLDKLYLYRVLLQKTQEIKNSGHGISMLHMTKEKMERVQVPVPPLTEQHRIVARVDELMTLCDRLEAQLHIAQTERHRLLESVLHEALNDDDVAVDEVKDTAEKGIHS